MGATEGVRKKWEPSCGDYHLGKTCLRGVGGRGKEQGEEREDRGINCLRVRDAVRSGAKNSHAHRLYGFKVKKRGISWCRGQGSLAGGISHQGENTGVPKIGAADDVASTLRATSGGKKPERGRGKGGEGEPAKGLRTKIKGGRMDCREILR